MAGGHTLFGRTLGRDVHTDQPVAHRSDDRGDLPKRIRDEAGSPTQGRRRQTSFVRPPSRSIDANKIISDALDGTPDVFIVTRAPAAAQSIPALLGRYTCRGVCGLMRRMHSVAIGLSIVLPLLCGCATLPRQAYSLVDQERAKIAGYAGIRHWADGSPAAFAASKRRRLFVLTTNIDA